MESLNINPWSNIWLHPKKTMRAILEWDPKRIIIWLAIFGGIFSAGTFLAQAYQRHPEWTQLKQVWYIILILIAGGILGLFHLYFGGWLYQLTSSWVGGKGNFEETKSAVGWSSYPFIIADIFLILNLVFYNQIWLQFVFGFLYLIAAVWGIVIFLNLLGESQQFSAWRALLAVIIAAALLFIAFVIILLLVPLVSPLFSALLVHT